MLKLYEMSVHDRKEVSAKETEVHSILIYLDEEADGNPTHREMNSLAAKQHLHESNCL